MAHRLKLKPLVLACAASAAFSALAQTAPQRLDPILVTGQAEPALDAQDAAVAGWAVPLAKTPQSITVLSADLLNGNAAQTLSQVLKLDASLADSYNTTGYIESVSLRGFLLDQGSNFSRNGLAVSNYAPIALENKERIEVLKGVAGLQAGVAAPGGLLNYVTKVPLKEPFTTATVHADGNGTTKLHLDSNTTLGTVGARLNLVDETLQSHFEHASGTRQLLSLALATELSLSTSITADFESHRKRQPSVPGLGLLDRNGDGLGDTLPDNINARLNLNNQSWSLPFEASSTVAQVTLQHQINTDWSAHLGLSTQSIQINDRIAFADGCSSAPTLVYPGLCSNGDVDVYDYRSDNESRRVSSWDAHLDAALSVMGTAHQARLGLSGHNAHADLPAMQAYNWVGTSNIYTPVALPGDASPTVLNTNNRERSASVYAMLNSQLSASVQSFAGLRLNQLSRSSERSDGSQAVSFDQTVSTSWAGLAWSPSAATLWYASWGQGVELQAVPNRPGDFANYGQTLPALKSTQTELGLKWQAQARLLLSAAVFSIDKPYADDVAGASAQDLPQRVAGAKWARHRGIEVAASGRLTSALTLQTSLMALDATYTRAIDPGLVGQRVTNVPRLKGSVFADYKIAALPGLSSHALATFESTKLVSADARVELPAAWQLDAGLRYTQRLGGQATHWQLNVENLTDRSYWREAPTTEWGGIYLFSAAPRTLRASVAVEF